jgi:hypothetical protein
LLNKTDSSSTFTSFFLHSSGTSALSLLDCNLYRILTNRYATAWSNSLIFSDDLGKFEFGPYKVSTPLQGMNLETAGPAGEVSS